MTDLLVQMYRQGDIQIYLICHMMKSRLLSSEYSQINIYIYIYSNII